MLKAMRVLWSCRCDAVFQKAQLTADNYLRVLHSKVLKWLAMPDLSIDHDAVRLYAGALQGWLTDRNIPVSEGSDVAGQKRAGPAQPSHSQIGVFGDRQSTGWAKRGSESQLYS